MGECLLSRRERLIVARHEVPGICSLDISESKDIRHDQERSVCEVLSVVRAIRAPKGLWDSAQGFNPGSAQGFNPGNRIPPAKSREGAPDRTRNATHQSHRDLSPLQGKSSYLMLPRVETLG